MGECCDHAAYDGAFGDRFARRIAQRCRRHGLNRTGRRIVDVASFDGIRDATVLESGGGVGELHLELLRRGARAAASRARRLLVFSYPPRNILSRSIFGFRNRRRQLRRNDFRAFVHPPQAMVAVAEAHGMPVRYRHPRTWWSVVGLERTA